MDAEVSNADTAELPAYVTEAIDAHRNRAWANGNGDYDADDSERVRLLLEQAIRRYAGNRGLRNSLAKMLSVEGDHMTACDRIMGATHLCTCGANEARALLKEQQ